MRFGITFQREFSLLDGKPREHPIQPIHQQRAVVTIGQQHLMARIEVAKNVRDDDFVREYAKAHNHTCAATELGEWCGHKI